MEEIERTGRFKPYEPPPMTECKQAIVDDSRSPFFVRVSEMLADGELEVDAITRRLRLSDIEGQIRERDSGFRKPPSGQIKADLTALGFKYERGKDGRFWRIPEGYQPPDRLSV